MAVRKLKDDEGNSYDVEVPDKDEDDDEDDDDETTIYLDEEDVEWLRRKRREEAEASRTSQKTTKKAATSDRVVKIRAKQSPPSTASRSEKSRVRTLRLA
jgi:hypothetical protein